MVKILIVIPDVATDIVDDLKCLTGLGCISLPGVCAVSKEEFQEARSAAF